MLLRLTPTDLDMDLVYLGDHGVLKINAPTELGKGLLKNPFPFLAADTCTWNLNLLLSHQLLRQQGSPGQLLNPLMHQHRSVGETEQSDQRYGNNSQGDHHLKQGKSISILRSLFLQSASSPLKEKRLTENLFRPHNARTDESVPSSPTGKSVQ